MATFKSITTYRLVVLLLAFLLGNSYLLLPAGSTGWTDLYLTVALHSGLLLLTTVAATTIFLYVRMMAVSSAEAEAKAAAADATAGLKQCALLLLALNLSAVSTFLAVFTFENGFEYRQGRASGLLGWPARVLLVILVLDHGIAAGMVHVAPIQAS